MDKGMRLLTYKKLLERFNSKYSSQITNKTYKNWFTKEMKIIPNGQITESTNSIPKEKKENTIVKPLELFGLQYVSCL